MYKEKSNSVRNKLIKSSLLSLFVSVILGLVIWSYPDYNLSLGIRKAAGLFIVFIILSSLFGDDDFNITKNWSDKMNNIKNIIGSVIGLVIVIAFSICIIIIASFLFDTKVW